jgi:hypothetical protein
MSGETVAASALALEIILPRLEIFCLPDQVGRFLQGDSDFRRPKLRCRQIAFMRDIAEAHNNIPVSTNALAKAFDCPRSRVKAALDHETDPPGQRGKNSPRDEHRERQIIDWIRRNADQETPVTKRQIRDYCITQFRTSITRGWVNSFLHRHRGAVMQAKSTG